MLDMFMCDSSTYRLADLPILNYFAVAFRFETQCVIVQLTLETYDLKAAI